MHMVVTGATGFIGRAIVAVALKRGHSVTAVTRDADKAKSVLPAGAEIYAGLSPEKLYKDGSHLIHLAWAEVGKYTEPKNLIDNLEPQFAFLKKMIGGGFTHLTVAGSCLEYGKIEGALSETTPTAPVTYYGLAKLTLCRMLELLNPKPDINWLRYFYVYGAGQRPQALIPQLLAAIERGDKTFNMSPGDQSRDFIHVDTLAYNTVLAAEQPKGLGIVNVGSGKATRVIDLARDVMTHKNAKMELNAGFYPYAAYEPHAFWADITKLKMLSGARFDDKIIL